MMIRMCSAYVLADMVSVEVLLISGGVLMLVVGGIFFALAALVAGFVKRRRLRNDSCHNGKSAGDQSDSA